MTCMYGRRSHSTGVSLRPAFHFGIASESICCRCGDMPLLCVFRIFLGIKVLIQSFHCFDHFFLTAFSASFHHQLSSHPLLFPVNCPHTSLPPSLLGSYVPPCHQMFPLVLIVSPLPFYRRRPSHSHLLISTILPYQFRSCLCFDFFTCISDTRTLCCEVVASDGIVSYSFGFPWHVLS